MSSHMVGERAFYPCHDPQARKVPHQRAVFDMGKQRFARLAAVFLYQFDGFGQQLHTGELAVLASLVFQPQCAVIVFGKVVGRDRHRVNVRSARIAGKEEQVAGNVVRPAVFLNLQVAQPLEVLTAQRPWCPFLLLRERVMLEMTDVRMAFLESNAADLLQHGQVVAYRFYAQPVFNDYIFLKLPYELLVQLAEGKVGDLVPLGDELCQPSPGIYVVRQGTGGILRPDERLDFLNMPVEQFQECHAVFHASLEQVPDRRRVKIHPTADERVECGVYGHQQPVYPRVRLHRFPALAVQTAFPRVPQLRRTGQLATELRHCPVHCNPSHYRGLARLVRHAPFQVEQHLEFLNLHTLTVFVAKLIHG